MDLDDEILKKIQEELNKKMDQRNSIPLEEMDNLSPKDMHHILYFTFDDISPIGFTKNISPETLQKIPFLNLVISYLKEIEQVGELKLTTRGNLPRKICIELYETGLIKEPQIESGIVKFSKEGDTTSIQNVKIISQLGGITKKRNNKISLTSKGKKLLQEDHHEELLKNIFITNCQKFNLGYHDGHPQNVGIQKTFGYALYLLMRYGKKQRKLSFYVDKTLTAFPSILDHFDDSWDSADRQCGFCYGIRVFERFLSFYDLVKYKKENWILAPLESIELRTTEIFDNVFQIRNDKFSFRKSEYQA